MPTLPNLNHKWKGFGVEVDICTDRLKHRASVWAGDRDGGPFIRDGNDFEFCHSVCAQRSIHPSTWRRRSSSSCNRIIGQARRDAVVHDHAILAQHQAVTRDQPPAFSNRWCKSGPKTLRRPAPNIDFPSVDASMMPTAFRTTRHSRSTACCWFHPAWGNTTAMPLTYVSNKAPCASCQAWMAVLRTDRQTAKRSYRTESNRRVEGGTLHRPPGVIRARWRRSPCR